MAALMVVAVTLPPLTVSHCESHTGFGVGGVHGFGVVSPSGRVAGSPDFAQSIARLDARIPDHACPCESVENNSNIEIRGKDARVASHLPLASDDVLRRKVSLAMQRGRTPDTEVHAIGPKEQSPLTLRPWPSEPKIALGHLPAILHLTRKIGGAHDSRYPFLRCRAARTRLRLNSRATEERYVVDSPAKRVAT